MDLVAADAPGAIPASVTSIESTGTATMIGAVAGQITLTALFSDRTSISRGDKIGLRPKPGLSHLFDTKTQNRIDRSFQHKEKP